jgi:hypothetical protein
MRGIEPGCLVPDFAEGGLDDLFGVDRVMQDAEGQGSEAQGVAHGQFPDGSDVAGGDPLQQSDIRLRLIVRNGVGGIHALASGDKEAGGGRQVTRVFNLLTPGQLAHILIVTNV